MTLILQSAYYSITALWPFIDIESFLGITGHKTDIWLVKTVAAQIMAVTVFLFLAIYRNRMRTAGIMAFLMALALGITETYFAFNGIISKIYLADALAELLFISGIVIGIYIYQNSPRV
jgi:hypothetical protein